MLLQSQDQASSMAGIFRAGARRMSKPINRRQFLKGASLTAAALALMPRVARAEQRGQIKLMGAPKSIVILGGGLAGLAAGYELKNAGHSVTILEARKFAGGRLQTLRNFRDGQYAEAGPLSFPEDPTFTFGYATDFNLPLRLANTFGLESIAHIRGSRFRIDGSGNANIPFSLKSNERARGVYGLIPFYLEDYMRKVGNPRHDNWPPDELKEIEGLSLRQLLENLGASDGAIDIIAASQLGLLGFGLDSFSAMDGVVTEAIAPSDEIFYEIADGNDQLPSVLKRKVKKQFRKRAIVKRIDQNQTGVVVTFLGPDGMETIN